MEHYDSNRVWERVQSAPAADFQNLGTLMEGLHLQIRIFQQLSKKLPPPIAAITRELSRNASRQLNCLKGMQILIAGNASAVRILPVSGDPPDLLLRQCYAQTIRLRTEYESRRNDPAYGHIFRTLSNDSLEQSRNILEILGSLAK